MSYHIIHIRTHRSFLSKKRGRLILKQPSIKTADLELPKSDNDHREYSEKSIALEDVHAVIIAAKGVVISSAAFSSLLEQGSSILHCNEKYEPVGKSLPLPKTIDKDCVNQQLERPRVLNKQLWKKLLYQKVYNHACVLDSLKVTDHKLWTILKSPQLDEGNAARHYWGYYFPGIGVGRMNRDRHLDTPPNAMLNYGYTVLTTLCHQALLAHGLICQLGVCHVTRYRADPLVYDFVEPFRAYIDLVLAEYFSQADSPNFDGWCELVGKKLRDIRVDHPRYSLKLINAIDKSASSLARTYSKKDIKNLWLPSFPKSSMNNDTTSGKKI